MKRIAICLTALYSLGCASSPAPIDCGDLTEWSDPNIHVSSAEAIAASDGTPGHCRVEGTINEEIGFELLLPEDWNSKLVMSGGGGFVGTTENYLQTSPMPGIPTPLERGYATVSTDTGHRGEVAEASWALDAPEREENFAHRAVHRTAETAKAAIEHFYGEPQSYAYFYGCSRGGGQALIEAQRHPEDFDGIIAGAPAMDWPGLAALFVYIQQRVFPSAEDSATPVITEDNRALLAREILAACDANDGLADGILEDPRRCELDPASLPRCEGAQVESECVTPEQLEAIRVVYAGPVVEGRRLAPGFPFGGENDPTGWKAWITGNLFPSDTPSLQFAFGTEFFKYLVYDDPEWDYKTYDFSTWEEDTAASRRLLNSTDTDLSAFRDTGAKLILWHGWSDPALTALETVDYYEGVEARDPDVRDYARMFMLPGVTHCSGGPGPDTVDWIGALEAWVERGEAPERIVARKHDENGSVTMTRPLCLYPLVARWDGSGDPNDAASFSCVQPEPVSAPTSD